MPIVATGYERWAGTVAGNGHCVAYVREAAGAPPTSHWRQGAPVRDHGSIAPGTAIATFHSNGRYGNFTDGRSHAAIYVRQTSQGIYAFDQWVGHPVAERLINFRQGRGDMVNDGDQFHVIELEET